MLLFHDNRCFITVLLPFSLNFKLCKGNEKEIHISFQLFLSLYQICSRLLVNIGYFNFWNIASSKLLWVNDLSIALKKNYSNSSPLSCHNYSKSQIQGHKTNSATRIGKRLIGKWGMGVGLTVTFCMIFLNSFKCWTHNFGLSLPS